MIKEREINKDHKLEYKTNEGKKRRKTTSKSKSRKRRVSIK